MIGRLAGLRGQLSSHWFASAFAMVYLLLSVTLGVALLSTPKPAVGKTAPVANTPTYDFRESPKGVPLPVPRDGTDDSGNPSGTTTHVPTTSATPTPSPGPATPAGYQRVSGPAGVKTVIPTGWRSSRAPGPGAMQATDPGDTARYVKYGGSAAPQLDIESSHIQYENGFASRATEYRRIQLSSADYGPHHAVVWEFEHRDGTVLKHVRSLYWRTAGKEYFVLAAAPATRWSEMEPIYRTMVAHATP